MQSEEIKPLTPRGVSVAVGFAAACAMYFLLTLDAAMDGRLAAETAVNGERALACLYWWIFASAAYWLSVYRKGS